MIYLTILHITAVLVCLWYLADRFRVQLVDAIPVLVCALVPVLYVLAMLHRLSWIDGIAALTVAAFVIWLVWIGSERRRAFVRNCLHNMTEASFLTAVFLLAAVILCTSAKVVTWWDDINFWATDVKALYALDGFAGKYANVAPEFGDYPPAAQLFKWWFLHFNPHAYREGLAFAGYYVMNLAFLLPLLKSLRRRNVLMMAGMAAALWFLPSIAEVYGYDGFCADLTMACIYGGFLYGVMERQQDAPFDCSASVWYFGRLGLYLGVLVLVKSIGFVWALFGLVFLFLYLRCGARGQKGIRSGQFRGFLVTAAMPVLTGGSWLTFCLLMRRVTKTTATAVKYMTTDEYGISGYAGEFAAAFIRAFVASPLHKERSAAIDLTPLGLYLCLLLVVVLFYRGIWLRRMDSAADGGLKLSLLSGKEGKLVLWFTVISGALFYAIIFVAHITIFATETQYLEADGMISSIERYGAPFTVGMLVFLAGIWLDRGVRLFTRDRCPAWIREYGTCLCLLLVVALTAGYRIGYHGLIGYRQETAAYLTERAGMIGADEAAFLEAVQALGRDTSTRVCYIRRDDAPRWVNNSYAAYEASPVSVVCRSVNLDDAPTDWLVQEIRSTHASYLYAEETDADAGAAFDGITQGEAFVCGVLYQIEDDGTQMKLTRVS